MPTEQLTVRPYRRGDRQAIRDICVATCWMGEPRAELIPDAWIWAEHWTRYFTDVERDLTWIVQPRAKDECDRSPQPVLGYLTGTRDVSRFDAYGLRLLPGIVCHAIRGRLLRRKGSRRAIAAMVGAILRGELEVPGRVLRHYPATCHTDLLPLARGQGIGTEMMRRFVARLRELGVEGLHVQTTNLNKVAGATLHKSGFAMAHSAGTRAFGHVCDERIEIQTWTRRICED